MWHVTTWWPLASDGWSWARSNWLTLLSETDVVRAQLLIADDNLPSQRVAMGAGFVLTDCPVVERHRKDMTLRLATWDRAVCGPHYSDTDVNAPKEAL